MRRILGRLLIAVVVLAGLVVAAFRFSPWPSVAIISYVFSRGDRISEEALEKHVPANIRTQRNLAYGVGRDEVFDINRPHNATGPLPVIVWVHGGAWIAGSKDGVGNYLKVLTGHGYATVSVEYSRGIGATYPRPVEQVNAALGYLAAHAGELGVDPDRIILAGDSAGAQIASQISLLTTDAAYARGVGVAPKLSPGQLRGALLLSGAFDLGAIDLDGEYGWFLRTVLWAYSGTRNFMQDDRFRLASVTDHVTGAFPPAFISSGNGDPLAPQAVRLARKLAALGVRTDSLFFARDRDPPLPHEYQFNLDTDAGKEALKRILNFVGSATRNGKTGGEDR